MVSCKTTLSINTFIRILFIAPQESISKRKFRCEHDCQHSTEDVCSTRNKIFVREDSFYKIDPLNNFYKELNKYQLVLNKGENEKCL